MKQLLLTALIGFALVGVTACERQQSAQEPRPGYGPLHKFVMVSGGRWSYAGTFPGRGGPNGLPQTEQSFRTLSGTIHSNVYEGLVLPDDPEHVINWKPKQDAAATVPASSSKE